MFFSGYYISVNGNTNMQLKMCYYHLKEAISAAIKLDDINDHRVPIEIVRIEKVWNNAK